MFLKNILLYAKLTNEEKSLFKKHNIDLTNINEELIFYNYVDSFKYTLKNTTLGHPVNIVTRYEQEQLAFILEKIKNPQKIENDIKKLSKDELILWKTMKEKKIPTNLLYEHYYDASNNKLIAIMNTNIEFMEERRIKYQIKNVKTKYLSEKDKKEELKISYEKYLLINPTIFDKIEQVEVEREKQKEEQKQERLVTLNIEIDKFEKICTKSSEYIAKINSELDSLKLLYEQKLNIYNQNIYSISEIQHNKLKEIFNDNYTHQDILHQIFVKIDGIESMFINNNIGDIYVDNDELINLYEKALIQLSTLKREKHFNVVNSLFEIRVFNRKNNCYYHKNYNLIRNPKDNNYFYSVLQSKIEYIYKKTLSDFEKDFYNAYKIISIGKDGENLVNDHLNKYNYILHNHDNIVFRFEEDGRSTTSETDNLIVSPYGIFAIEVKNIGSTTTGINDKFKIIIEKDGRWIKEYANGKKDIMNNITEQTYRHIAYNERLINQEMNNDDFIKVYPLIVIANEKVEIVNHSNIPVVRPSNIYHEISMKNDNLSKQTIEDINNIIISNKQPLVKFKNKNYFKVINEFYNFITSIELNFDYLLSTNSHILLDDEQIKERLNWSKVEIKEEIECRNKTNEEYYSLMNNFQNDLDVILDTKKQIDTLEKEYYNEMNRLAAYMRSYHNLQKQRDRL